MAIPTYSLKDIENVQRLPGRIQIVSDPDLPAYFFAEGGWFFINLARWLNIEGTKLASSVVEGGELSAPPAGFKKVTNIYVNDQGALRFVVAYDDEN